MSGEKMWYLTKNGWFDSSEIDLSRMSKGVDIYSVWKSFEYEFYEEKTYTAKCVWDFDDPNCSSQFSNQGERLYDKYGDRPKFAEKIN